MSSQTSSGKAGSSEDSAADEDLKQASPEPAEEIAQADSETPQVADVLVEADEERMEEVPNREDELLAQIDSLKDQLLRAQAEMENQRRRMTREQSERARYGVAPLAEALFPLADNLQRALDMIPESLRQHEDSKGFVEGVEMTANILSEAFRRCGIEAVGQIGDAFDPDQHQAIQEVPGEGIPAKCVVEVMQRGYRLHDRLLRPAMVLVAKG